MILNATNVNKNMLMMNDEFQNYKNYLQINNIEKKTLAI